MFILVVAVLTLVTITSGRNDSPIIGVLSQEAYSVRSLFPNETIKSFIAASYVKYLESAGARVVPIWIGRDRNYYQEIINTTNGIFWPGGATWFNESGGYAEAGEMLYEYAVEKNKEGIYYPIWGTCLGMELLIDIDAGQKEVRQKCMAKNISLPLEFQQGYRNSRLFKNTPEEIIKILRNENVTYNYHKFCITEDLLVTKGLLNNWTILSTNKDINGIEFISTLEHRKLPFYGIQFHPEKNQYEFKSGANIPHSDEAVKISQYFANFFVEECRKNDPVHIENGKLIYNFSPRYTGNNTKSAYEQLYVFTW